MAASPMSPRRVRVTLALGLVALAVGAGVGGRPQAKPPARSLLYPATLDAVPDRLRPAVTRLLNPEQGQVDAADVRPAGVFARVVTRKHILDAATLKQGGVLGSRPFVFVTVPEALYGRTLLQVFAAIGYSAEEVLTGQLGEEKVVVVFRWEDGVALHAGRDGTLPAAWHCGVYPATWDNLFALVEKMAADPNWHYVREANRPAGLTRLALQSPKEAQFLLGFPDAGKRRVKAASYYALQETQGADWEYRQFLERSMSAAEHFVGDGTSKPTLTGPAPPPVGFPEFLGPNRALTALPEVAVIGLGSLRVAE